MGCQVSRNASKTRCTPGKRRVEIRQKLGSGPTQKAGAKVGVKGKSRGKSTEFSCFDLLLPLLSHCDPYSYPYFNRYFLGGSRTLLVPYFKSSGFWGLFERGEKTPTPKISTLLRKRPVLLRANFVLTKDRKRPYYRHFCGKMHREGSCSKAAGGP